MDEGGGGDGASGLMRTQTGSQQPLARFCCNAQNRCWFRSD